MALPGHETIDLSKTTVHVLGPMTGEAAFKPKAWCEVVGAIELP